MASVGSLGAISDPSENSNRPSFRLLALSPNGPLNRTKPCLKIKLASCLPLAAEYAAPSPSWPCGAGAIALFGAPSKTGTSPSSCHSMVSLDWLRPNRSAAAPKVYALSALSVSNQSQLSIRSRKLPEKVIPPILMGVKDGAGFGVTTNEGEGAGMGDASAVCCAFAATASNTKTMFAEKSRVIGVLV